MKKLLILIALLCIAGCSKTVKQPYSIEEFLKDYMATQQVIEVEDGTLATDESN